MKVKKLLFTMTLVILVSGHSYSFETDADKLNNATKLVLKATRAMELKDTYSMCRYSREALDKMYDVDLNKLIDDGKVSHVAATKLKNTIEQLVGYTELICKNY